MPSENVTAVAVGCGWLVMTTLFFYSKSNQDVESIRKPQMLTVVISNITSCLKTSECISDAFIAFIWGRRTVPMSINADQNVPFQVAWPSCFACSLWNSHYKMYVASWKKGEESLSLHVTFAYFCIISQRCTGTLGVFHRHLAATRDARVFAAGTVKGWGFGRSRPCHSTFLLDFCIGSLEMLIVRPTFCFYYTHMITYICSMIMIDYVYT